MNLLIHEPNFLLLFLTIMLFSTGCISGVHVSSTFYFTHGQSIYKIQILRAAIVTLACWILQAKCWLGAPVIFQ